MAAQRPAVFAALKTALVNGVTAVNGRVYLPWDAQPETVTAAAIEIAIEDSIIDDSVIIGTWEHRIDIKIGCVKQGKFDYAAIWEILNASSAAIAADPTLSGNATRIELTGGGDHIVVAGEKILWMHISAQIVYRTQKGSL